MIESQPSAGLIDDDSMLSLPLRVYIEDTDAGGIVYYVNYLKYMERARTEFMRQLGYGKAALFDEQLMFVVHSLTINYRSSAKLDDQLVAQAKLQKVGKAAIVFEQMIVRDTQILCDAQVKIACVDRELGKACAMPTSLLDKLPTIA